MFHHILVGTDFSEASLAALNTAVRLARSNNARLTVLHVTDAPVEQADRELKATLNKASTQGLSVEPLITGGNPAEKLLQTAASHNCDLIVISPTGKGLMERLLIGSTTARVLKEAKDPVWVARPDNTGNITRIIVGVDNSGPSTLALTTAIAQAIMEQAVLDVVHVADAQDDSAELERAQQQFREFCDQHHLRVETDKVQHNLLVGNPSQAIVQHALDTQANLIVVGSKEHGLLHDMFVGSTAEKILRDTPCCLLIARDED